MGLLDDAERTIDVPIIRLSAVDMPSAPPMSISARKPEIPGYEIVKILGTGGEGTVWEAIETKLDRPVAIKIHSSRAQSDATSNLWTEAKVAARIGDPSIVTVLDVGLTQDGRRFYAMELVRGTDVADLLKSGPLEPRRALEIAADVARAVAAAHEHGVVHRDLKPRNVIVDVANRARVVDFGIALDLRSGGDRLAGMVAGSPRYMAPEQIRGGTVGPFTDIWAIGVLLFEMLTGVSPFERKTYREILGAIGIDNPGVPSARVKGIHRDIDAIVRRCLEPARSDRFPSSAALHEAIRAVLDGQRPMGVKESETAYRPRPSLDRVKANIPQREQADRHFAWTWIMQSPPEKLWPYLSDTQRLGEALGVRPMVVETKRDADGCPVHVGTQSALGMTVTWDELPFEWVAEREHSKFRNFHNGPVEALWNRITLTPRADGGTDLAHDLWIKTRNWFGRAATALEVDNLFAGKIDQYYRRLDVMLVEGGAKEVDAHAPTPKQRARVAAGVGNLLRQGFDPRLVKALEDHLLHAPNRAVRVLRPFALADRWQTSRQETVDAFMHAASHGLLAPTWSVLCPVCRVSCGQVASLESLEQDSRCATCNVDFQTDLEEYVELVFTPHPAVRNISSTSFCFGPPAERPHVLAQKNVARHDEVTVNVELEPGTYRIIGEHSHASCEILATTTGFLERAILDFDGNKIHGGGIIVRAGAVAITMRSSGDGEELLRIESVTPPRDRFTAASALLHPTFRMLFEEQLPKAGTCLPVKDLSFVFVRLPAREVTQKLGDAAAALELSRWKDVVAAEASKLGGRVVPSTLAIVAIAFSSEVVAVRAAFAIHETNRGVAIALHQGSCVGIAHQGRLELFGETLQRGESLVLDCPAGQIGVSNTLMSNRNVALLVTEGRSVDSKANGAGAKLVLLNSAA